MPQSPSSPFHPFLEAMVASGAAIADGIRAEIEASGAFIQTQMAALPALTAIPPASPAAALARAGDLWAQAIEAGIASAARAAEVVAKASTPLVKALKPAS